LDDKNDFAGLKQNWVLSASTVEKEKKSVMELCEKCSAVLDEIQKLPASKP
jgi:hypothetical protein